MKSCQTNSFVYVKLLMYPNAQGLIIPLNPCYFGDFLLRCGVLT